MRIVKAMGKIAADSQKANGGITALTGGLNQFTSVTGKGITVLNSLGKAVNTTISDMGALSGAITSKQVIQQTPFDVIDGKVKMLGDSTNTLTSKLRTMGQQLQNNVGSFSLDFYSSVFTLQLHAES